MCCQLLITASRLASVMSSAWRNYPKRSNSKNSPSPGDRTGRRQRGTSGGAGSSSSSRPSEPVADCEPVVGVRGHFDQDARQAEAIEFVQGGIEPSRVLSCISG